MALTGPEALSFGASPVTVTDEALTETGYEATSVAEQTVTRNFSAVGRTGQVEVTNPRAMHERETVTALGQSTAVKKFEGSATLSRSEVDVYVHAAKFKHEGVSVGIYLQADDDEAKMLRLIESLGHSGGK